MILNNGYIEPDEMDKIWSIQNIEPEAVMINLLESKGLGIDKAKKKKISDGWDEQNDEQFIQIVKVFKILWAKTSNSYKVLGMKENCWVIIGKVFGVDGMYLQFFNFVRNCLYN